MGLKEVKSDSGGRDGTRFGSTRENKKQENEGEPEKRCVVGRTRTVLFSLL